MNANYSLKIADIQSRDYPGGELKIEKQLEDGDGYKKYYVSYPSDGLKIYGILVIPNSHSGKPARPELNVISSENEKSRDSTTPAPLNDKGIPLVVFNRGFVDPAEYASDRQYMRYINYLAKAGFAVFKSDYRGIGESEGEIDSVVNSANAADVLNGLSSLRETSKQSADSKSPAPLNDIDFNNVFIWGHSMGGMITLQCLLANKIFKGAAIWAGFIIPYFQIIDRWLNSPMTRQQDRAKALLEQFGDPDKNPEIWRSISPYYFADEFPCQIQLHHGREDKIIPITDAQEFQKQLQKFNKDGGLIEYPHGGHNLNEPDVLPEAMKNTINFFKSQK